MANLSVTESIPAVVTLLFGVCLTLIGASARRLADPAASILQRHYSDLSGSEKPLRFLAVVEVFFGLTACIFLRLSSTYLLFSILASLGLAVSDIASPEWGEVGGVSFVLAFGCLGVQYVVAGIRWSLAQRSGAGTSS